MRSALSLVILVLGSAVPAGAAEYFVAPHGNDGNPGTRQRPFRTIQRAADVMVAGDTCFVRQGVYRETVRPRHSGRAGQPIRFAAFPGELVTLSGTELIRSDWQVHREKIYKAHVDRTFEQLFVDGEMMIEARWPNASFEQLLQRSCWARAQRGSRYGLLCDPQLAKTGVDWTGALATLNVTHQFYTWTRYVTRHQAGQPQLEYPKDFGAQTEMRYGNKTAPWEDDRYYLSGKLEALDAPTEWHLDRKKHVLYLWTRDGTDPSQHRVEAKARDYVFEAVDCDYIELHGFHLFGATFSFRGCNHCVVEGCHLLFPTYSRELSELAAPPARHNTPRTEMAGDWNTVRNCSLAYTPTAGLVMTGRQNRVENNLIHDICWSGSLRYVAIGMNSPPRSAAQPGGIVRGNTVFRCGNAMINYRGQPYVIERNHVYSGGMACKDVALIYTGQPSCAGSVVRYNWVHGCWTEEGNGLGIRGDDQTRQLTVHHNVVWDCGRDGIIVKGDGNQVYNNTCLFIGKKDRLGNYIVLPTRAEPKKPWRRQHPLLPVQNRHSRIANNAARTINGDQSRRTPFPFKDCLESNFQGPDLHLVDMDHWDFRPAADSPLVDAGVVIPGITDGYQGRAPDVGAYEYGGDNWKPGHRNGVWIAVAGDNGHLVLRVALRMPIRTPVELTVGTGSRRSSGPTLRFAPSSWMQPQQVVLAGGSGADRAVSIHSPWGSVQATVASARDWRGKTLWFPEPDIGTPRPLDIRFNSWRPEEQQLQDKLLAKLARLRRQGSVRNLLKNGDFEAGSLSPWFKATNTKPIPEAMKVQRVRKPGGEGWCLQLQCDNAAVMQSGVLKCLQPLPSGLVPGTYVLSYDLRLEDLEPQGRSGMFCSYIRTATSPQTGTNAGQMASAVTARQLDWTHRDVVIQIPSGARPRFVSLQLHRATGTVWVDDVGLWKCP